MAFTSMEEANGGLKRKAGMENKSQAGKGELDLLKQRISHLEDRMTRLEEDVTETGYSGSGIFRFQKSPVDESLQERDSTRDISMESRVGEYGMAWLGNIVLFFGILFLSQYLQNNNQEIISLVIGFVSVGLVYLLGHLTRRSLPYMSRLFSYNGHLLLYIQAMRIGMFPGSQIIDNSFLGHALVLVVLISLIYLAYRNSSQILAILVWLMAVLTAIAGGSTHFMLSLMLGITISAIFFAIRKAWWTGLMVSIFLAYFIYLMWITGNPFISKSFEFISLHQLGYVYLFACALAYSFLALLPAKDGVSQNQLNQSIVLNGTGLFVYFHPDGPGFFHRNLFPVFRPYCSFLYCLLHLVRIAGDMEIHRIAVCYLQFCGSQYYYCRDLSLPAGISPSFHPGSVGSHRGTLVPFQIHGDYEHHPFWRIADRLLCRRRISKWYKFLFCAGCTWNCQGPELEKATPGNSYRIDPEYFPLHWCCHGPFQPS